MTGAGHNSQKQVRSILERILRLKEEQDELGNDIKEIYAEAKSNGYDKTALGQAVAIIRKRAKDPQAFEERNTVTDLYLAAFDGTGTEVANIERAHTRAPDALPNPGTTVPKDEPDLSFRDEGNGVVSVAMNDALVSEIGATEAVAIPAAASVSVSAGQAADESPATFTSSNRGKPIDDIPPELRRKSA